MMGACILQGLRRGLNVSLGGEYFFKLHKQERKGVFLQLQGSFGLCSTLQEQQDFSI